MTDGIIPETFGPPPERRVHIVEYSDEWPREFASIASRLTGALGAAALRTEHVGSTAVPGLAAKPVIDVAMTVPDADDEPAYFDAVLSVGFDLRRREPNRRFFRSADRRFNLHVHSEGSQAFDDLVLLRDHLRQCTGDRARYATLKRELARREWNAINDYAEAKTSLIHEMLTSARTVDPRCGKPATRVRAVGFDLDGTLFDHRGSATAGLDAFLTALGKHPTPARRAIWFDAEDAHFERWRAGEITFEQQRRERLRTVLPQYGLAVPTDPGDLDALFAAYLRQYQLAWTAFPDSASVVTSLRSLGLAVGVLTNGSSEQQRDKLREIGLLHLVDVVCISDEIGVQKPNPGAFLELAGQLGRV